MGLNVVFDLGRRRDRKAGKIVTRNRHTVWVTLGTGKTVKRHIKKHRVVFDELNIT